MQKVNGIARHLLSEELVAAAGSSGFLAPLQSTWCHPDFTSSWRHRKMCLKCQATEPHALFLPSFLWAPSAQ